MVRRGHAIDAQSDAHKDQRRRKFSLCCSSMFKETILIYVSTIAREIYS